MADDQALPRLIQISATVGENQTPAIFALDEVGGVWRYWEAQGLDQTIHQAGYEAMALTHAPWPLCVLVLRGVADDTLCPRGFRRRSRR